MLMGDLGDWVHEMMSFWLAFDGKKALSVAFRGDNPLEWWFYTSSNSMRLAA